ncbi:MAG: error-prone polymerase, partial [Actinomycetota bacterium]
MQGPKTWAELEARLSDRAPAPDDRAPTPDERGRDGRAPGSTTTNAGGDGPAFGRRRQPYQPIDTGTPTTGTPRPVVPYAELHCHSNFSFLAGASHPEELVEEAQRLELSALAITDHNGLYGVVRFAEAARAVGLPTVFGSDITVHDQNGSGQLVVLADGPTGYANLSRALSLAQLSGSKGEPRCTLPLLADNAHDRWWVLTGDHRGIVPRALVDHGPQAALRELQRLIDAFGRHRVLVELWDHGEPLDSARNDALAELAARVDVRCVASNNVHYATPARRRLATAMAAVGKRCSLNDMDPWLPAAAAAHVRSGSEQLRRFARYPGVVEVAAEVGAAAAFDLSLVAPNLPPYPCPDGLTEMEFLRHLTEQGATRRYGERPRDGEDLSIRARAWRTIDHELHVIETLGFAGYFLVVWDIVRFCERADIYCQGRGSAANSAVCYSLGITKAD